MPPIPPRAPADHCARLGRARSERPVVGMLRTREGLPGARRPPRTRADSRTGARRDPRCSRAGLHADHRAISLWWRKLQNRLTAAWTENGNDRRRRAAGRLHADHCRIAGKRYRRLVQPFSIWRAGAQARGRGRSDPAADHTEYSRRERGYPVSPADSRRPNFSDCPTRYVHVRSTRSSLPPNWAQKP
ncbi:hypothetical protein OKW50_005070 [Paraburkholderia youngii]